MITKSMDALVWLRKQLETGDNDLLREMVRSFAEGLMGAEADLVCGAPYRVVSPDRTNRRNGYRTRRWDTRVGTIDLRIPKLRESSYFPEWLLDARTRSERAFIQVVAEAYVRGVSTRRVEGLVEALGVASLSKSQVSELAKGLDEMVTDFRNRPLDAGPYTYVWADALTMKVREGGRIVNIACLLAVGVNGEGHREILGIDVATTEDGAATVTTVNKTRPYRPQTNGKIERYHRILLEEWAYIRPWTSETQRARAYTGFVHFYNHHRSHGALGWATPTSILKDNLPGYHT